MKKIVKVQEIPDEGLKKLLGERVTIFCAVYIYTGKLVGVNDTCVLLEDAGVVFETGAFSNTNWKDCQKIPGSSWYVQRNMIESFGILK